MVGNVLIDSQAARINFDESFVVVYIVEAGVEAELLALYLLVLTSSLIQGINRRIFEWFY